MPDETNRPASQGDLLRNSLLYRRFQAERAEVLKHKWYESEKAGHDSGLERAQIDWSLKHRARWLKEWQRDMQVGVISKS